MADITRLPVEYRRPAVLTGKEIWATPEPTEEMIWEICPYTRGGEHQSCQGCPKFTEDENGEKWQSMCRGLAEEACRIVFAMQARGQKVAAAHDSSEPAE